MSPSALPEELEATESGRNETLPVTTVGGDWNSSARETAVSVLEPVPIEDEAVILTGALGPIVPGQLIEGEVIQEVFFDGAVSDIPVSLPLGE